MLLPVILIKYTIIKAQVNDILQFPGKATGGRLVSDTTEPIRALHNPEGSFNVIKKKVKRLEERFCRTLMTEAK